VVVLLTTGTDVPQLDPSLEITTQPVEVTVPEAPFQRSELVPGTLAFIAPPGFQVEDGIGAVGVTGVVLAKTVVGVGVAESVTL
jgi:hypothetical protein